jgi:hypothetical protein
MMSCWWSGPSGIGCGNACHCSPGGRTSRQDLGVAAKPFRSRARERSVWLASSSRGDAHKLPHARTRTDRTGFSQESLGLSMELVTDIYQRRNGIDLEPMAWSAST